MTLTTTQLTAAMQEALRQEWLAVKGSAITDTTVEDMRLIFAAVSRGLLNYLETHQNDFISTMTLEEPSGTRRTHTVVSADLDISANS